jgi:putative tricarboxylic transport membrane protein
MDRKPHPATDLAFCLLIVVIATLLLVGAASLPAPKYDPLGSAAVPRTLAVLILLAAVPIAAGAVLRMVRDTESLPLPWSPAAALRGAAVFAALVVFILAMAWGWATFWVAGTVYVAVSAVLIGGFDWRRFAVSAVGAAILCSLLAVVFSRYFFVNLP